MGNLRKIGALWAKEGKNGPYYSGSLDAAEVKSALVGGETRLLVFPVRQRRERGPALEIFCAPDERSGARPDRTARDEREAPRRPSQVNTFEDEDPFA